MALRPETKTDSQAKAFGCDVNFLLFQLMKIIQLVRRVWTAFQAVPLPTFQPPKAQTAFGAKIRAAARMAKAAFLPSEAKAQRCVQLQKLWENGKVQKGVESEKNITSG